MTVWHGAYDKRDSIIFGATTQFFDIFIKVQEKKKKKRFEAFENQVGFLLIYFCKKTIDNGLVEYFDTINDREPSLY